LNQGGREIKKNARRAAADFPDAQQRGLRRSFPVRRMHDPINDPGWSSGLPRFYGRRPGSSSTDLRRRGNP